jgi:TolA-binding protein
LNHLYRAEHYGSFSDSADAEIALQKGLCLEGVGRKSEALAVYHHLILKYPKSDLVPQAWARIEQ